MSEFISRHIGRIEPSSAYSDPLRCAEMERCAGGLRSAIDRNRPALVSFGQPLGMSVRNVCNGRSSSSDSMLVRGPGRFPRTGDQRSFTDEPRLPGIPGNSQERPFCVIPSGLERSFQGRSGRAVSARPRSPALLRQIRTAHRPIGQNRPPRRGGALPGRAARRYVTCPRCSRRRQIPPRNTPRRRRVPWQKRSSSRSGSAR